MERLREIGENVRHAMRLKQSVEIEFGDRIGVAYHDGIKFAAFSGHRGAPAK